jgi:transcriptional regulator with XRE-family HTH domain
MAKTEFHKLVMDNLRYLLEVHTGGNQLAFAKRLGISPGTLTPWLEGQTIPGGKHLLGISNEFNVSVDWLLKGSVPDRKPIPQVVIEKDSCPDWLKELTPRLAALDKKGQQAVTSLLEAIEPRATEEQTKPPPRKAAAGPARARRR